MNARDMTLRDYFAAMALQSLITFHSKKGGPYVAYEEHSFIEEMHSFGFGAHVSNLTVDDKPISYGVLLAHDAYGIADSMIEARKMS
jgi:hypothetical protein